MERNQLRQMYFNTWEKFKNAESLSALEKQIVEIIQQHPEYHRIIENPEDFLNENYHTDNNPFLHLSLHLGLREQLETDRPPGIAEIYQQLLVKHTATHNVLHQMMDVMANLLWDAKTKGILADDKIYLENLKKLL